MDVVHTTGLSTVEVVHHNIAAVQLIKYIMRNPSEAHLETLEDGIVWSRI